MTEIKAAFEPQSQPEDEDYAARKAKIRTRVRRYLGLAFHVAAWSKDPSTKVGCVVVGKNRRQIAIGYNGFPEGIADTEERLNDRPTKYRLTQHAERNAVDNATFDLTGATLVTTLHPCVECAKSILSKGIATVVTTPAPIREPWKQSAEWAAELFKEAGVEVVVIEVARAVSGTAGGIGGTTTKIGSL